jgi:hypothetical protein
LIFRGLNFSRNADIGQIGHLWMDTNSVSCPPLPSHRTYFIDRIFASLMKAPYSNCYQIAQKKRKQGLANRLDAISARIGLIPF